MWQPNVPTTIDEHMVEVDATRPFHDCLLEINPNTEHQTTALITGICEMPCVLVRLQCNPKRSTPVLTFKFHYQLLPSVFDTFFNPVSNIHRYNTRLSSRMTYAIPKARTNYGIFNTRFQDAKVWNDISDDISVLRKCLSQFLLLK